MLATTPDSCLPAVSPGTTMARLELRCATMDDAAAITRIYNASLLAAAPHAGDAQMLISGRRLAASRVPRLTAEGLAPWIAAHHANGRPLWLAQVQGESVGWLSLLGFSDRPACVCAGEVSIYIAPAWQRQGVGRQLIAHAMREAPGWQIDRLMAFIWHDNPASLGLFRAHGFSTWGALPGVVWAEGQARDMLILGCSLEPRPEGDGPSAYRAATSELEARE